MESNTLSRKMVLHSAALVAVLLVLGVAGLVSLLSLRRHVRNAISEYTELRQIEGVRLHAARAAGLLQSGSIDLSGAEVEVRTAIAALELLEQFQSETSEGSTRHEEAEADAIGACISDLSVTLTALNEVRSSPRESSEWAQYVERLRDVQGRLDILALDADALVSRTEQRTDRAVLRAALIISATAGAIIAIAVGISISQYRGVMRPLRLISGGVRAIAGGHFDRQLPLQGEREWAELTGDFNRMAAELGGLYRDLEAKVEQKSRELICSERLASVGFLAAGVAHEINNPLSIMSGFAELSLRRLHNLRSGPRGDSVPGCNGTAATSAALEDAEHSLKVIRDEAFRCREITEKLLAMAGGGGGVHEPVRLSPVVEDVAAMVAAHKEYRGRHIEIALESDDLVAMANDAELRQVLLNLCFNALDAVDPEGGRVVVVARSDDDRVEIRIEDNGCGMTPETLSHVFEPFYTTRNGKTRGTGLGLAISRAIIEGFGGSIRAHSDGPGAGSSFVITLPAAVTTEVSHA